MFKLTLFFFIVFGIQAQAYQILQILRADGSKIQFYLATPAQRNFPVIFYIHGSTCNTTLPMFQSVAQTLSANGVAVVTLEKYGVNQTTTSCPKEYLENNTIQSRIRDHLLVMNFLRLNLVSWNKKVVWAGGSEGGQVASLVAPLVRETAMVVMMASGGGLTMAEELPLAFEKSMKRKNAPQDQIQKMKIALLEQYKVIKANPTPYEEWLSDGKTARNTYRYWDSILWIKTMPSLEKLNVPMLLVHGTEDTSCPVESSDILSERFKILGKANLVYRRYQGLEHNFSDLNGKSHMQKVLKETFSWILQNLSR